MALLKCVVCLQNPTEIPPEYLQFSHKLIWEFCDELSSKMNTLKFSSAPSVPFCSHCRVYLISYAKLNDQLKSLSSGPRQLEGKQIAKIRLISSLQEYVGKNNNNDQDCDTNMASTFKFKVEDQLKNIEVEQQKLEDQLGNLEDQMEKLEDLLENLEYQWVPTKLPRPKLMKLVEQVSETKFIFNGKYPFERRDFSFQCGSCPAVSNLCKENNVPIWYSMITHIRKWHEDSGLIRKKKIEQKFIEIAPDRFQRGDYLVERHENKWRCLACDHLSPIGPQKEAFKYIRIHIDGKHKNPGKNFICELCGALLISSQALKQHKIGSHETPSGPHPCSRCGKLFRTRYRASQHEQNVHAGRYFKYLKYFCETCGKRFKDKLTMQDHIAFVHNGQRGLKCKDCGKDFASRNALSIHQNNHTGKRKYGCDICGMEFTQLYSVTRHKNTVHKN